MICNIMLQSEFRDKYLDGGFLDHWLPDGSWGIVLGTSDIKIDTSWIFVDRIAMVDTHIKPIIDTLSNTTIHELIHLCGILDENMTCLGVELVK